MTGLLLLIRMAIVAALAAEFFFVVPWAAPDFEAHVAPVLTAQQVDSYERPDPATACWTWRFDKARVAQFEDAGWTLRAEGRVYPYQRVRTVADSQPLSDAIVRRPVRPGQWSRKCIDLPPSLVGRPFRVTGFVEYRTARTGAWWTVRQPVPEVEFP